MSTLNPIYVERVYWAQKDAMQSVLGDLFEILDRSEGFKREYLGHLMGFVQSEIVSKSLENTKRELQVAKGVV